MCNSKKNILKYLLILNITILIIVAANAQTFISFEEPYRLKNVQAINNKNGQKESWHVGGFGTLVIFKDNNRIEKKISKVDLNSIFFVDDQVIFVTGNSGELLVSTDRGDNWQKIPLKTKINLKGIYCLNENNCRIVGDKHGLLISGGINGKWKEENIVSAGNFVDVYFVNENIGFVVGRDNLLLKTGDGGANWERINLSYKTRVTKFINGSFWFEAVSFLNEEIGCITGWDVGMGIVACTKDQGENWKVTLIEETFEGIVWKSKKEVYLIGKYGKNYVSKDEGKTWNPLTKKMKSHK